MHDIKPSEISAILRQEMAGFSVETELEETGTVLQVGDGIARIYGLSNAWAGEMISCNDEELTGVVLNLEEDNAGVVLLGDARNLREGDIVKKNRAYCIGKGRRRAARKGCKYTWSAN